MSGRDDTGKRAMKEDGAEGGKGVLNELKVRERKASASLPLSHYVILSL